MVVQLIEWMGLAWFGLCTVAAVGLMAYMFLWAIPNDLIDRYWR